MRKVILASLMLLLLVSINAGAATIWVDIVDASSSMFNPYNLYVPTGTTVVWTNYDAVHHTVTADSGLFSSPILLSGQTFSFTFNTVGSYSYHCSIHPMMQGVINVVSSTATLPFLVAMTPLNPPIVIPAGGGTFQYHAQVTNQSGSLQSVTFFVKMYSPSNTLPTVPLSKPGLNMPAGASKGANINQNVPASSPAGTYHFVGCAGSNPDTIKGWASFDFSKAVIAADIGDWSSVYVTDWADEQPAGPVSNVAAQPNAVRLSNYPQPFNPSTTIRFSLPTDGVVSLNVFNVAGARVATLVNGVQTAGEHQVTFNAASLPSGLYLYTLNYAGQTITNKMMLIK
jgi:plastocyanin